MIKLFKACALILTVIITLSALPQGTSLNANSRFKPFEGEMTFNGSRLNLAVPVLIDENGRALSPVRPLLDALGCNPEDISYDANAGILVAENFMGVRIIVTLGHHLILVETPERGRFFVEVVTVPQSVDLGDYGEWVYLPVSTICMIFGAEARYDARSKNIDIVFE